MRKFTKENFLIALLEHNYLEKFVESGWCWGGCQVDYSIKLPDFLLLTTGYFLKNNVEVNTRVKKLLHGKGLKGVNKFKMPEQIAWCMCQPRFDQHKKNIEEFFNLIENITNQSKRQYLVNQTAT